LNNCNKREKEEDGNVLFCLLSVSLALFLRVPASSFRRGAKEGGADYVVDSMARTSFRAIILSFLLGPSRIVRVRKCGKLVGIEKNKNRGKRVV
jgi:hypothetical protein